MNRHAPIVIAAAAALIVGTCLVSLQGQAAPAPAGLAVVDVQKALNALAEKTAIEARITRMGEGFQKEALARREQIKKLETDLKVALQPGTAAYEQTSEKLQLATIEFQAWQRFSQRKIEREKAVNIEALYRKINAAAERIAKQRGFALVLTISDIDSVKANSQQQLAGMIQLRSVLYAAPQTDITDPLTQLLNNEFNNRK